MSSAENFTQSANFLSAGSSDCLVCLCWGVMAQSTQWVMLIAVSLPNHTFTGQAWSSKQLTSTVHILLPETDDCHSWISRRERMTVENITWSVFVKECYWPGRGVEPPTYWSPVGRTSKWATNALSDCKLVIVAETEQFLAYLLMTIGKLCLSG